MADLTLDVETRGAEQAAAGMDKVASSTAKAGATWDRLKQKLGSGEVLRNAAASAALLASGAGNTTDKIAALGGALASIPGPVGLVASAVAVGATALGVFSKQAEVAEKRAAELAATLANLGKERGAARVSLGDKLGAAGVSLGAEARRFGLAGGRRSERDALQALNPADAGAGLRQATLLAQSSLTDEQRKKAIGVAQETVKFGLSVTDETIQRLIKALEYEAESRTGIALQTRNPRTGALGPGEDIAGDAELIAESQAGRLTQADVFSRAQEATTPGARAVADNVRRITASAVADAVRTAESATTGARSLVAREALGAREVQQFSQSAQGVESAVRELTSKIEAMQPSGAAPPAQTNSAWLGDSFQYQPTERSKP